MTPSSDIVTVVRFGGHWCAMKHENNNAELLNIAVDKISAIGTAQRFSHEHHIPFVEDAVEFNKPVVTIWKANGCWIPAKIFEENIIGAGQTCKKKSEAIEMAEKVAVRDGLQFIPAIGESCFKD